MQKQMTATKAGRSMSARAIAAAKTRQLKREIAQAVAVLSESEALVMYLTANKTYVAEGTQRAYRAAQLAQCVYVRAHDRARWVQA